MEASDYSFLYTCGMSGRSSTPRYVMTTEDAKKWCSSELSKGILHGNPWAYFFTTVESFVTCHWGRSSLRGGEVVIDLRKMDDNGSMDEKLLRVGVRKLTPTEIRDILGKLGFKILV